MFQMETAASVSHRSSMMERISSSSSDSDDSDIAVPWKRRAVGKKASTKMAVDEMLNSQSAFSVVCQQNKLSMPKKKNTIWCSVLQEQGLTEDLRSIGVVNVDDQVSIERNSESYHVDKEVFEKFIKDSEREAQMKTHGMPSMKVNTRKRKLDRESEEIAWKIIKVLNEPNHDLIRSIISVIGKDHAMDLLHKTEDVEDAGGMMIMNGKRRRTPGGVYIQLLKNDPKLTKEQLKLIFQDEYKKQELNRKQARRLKRQAKSRKVARKLGQMAIENPNNTSVMDCETGGDQEQGNGMLVPQNLGSHSNNDSNTSSSLEDHLQHNPEVDAVKADSELEEGELLD